MLGLTDKIEMIHREIYYIVIPLTWYHISRLLPGHSSLFGCGGKDSIVQDIRDKEHELLRIDLFGLLRHQVISARPLRLIHRKYLAVLDIPAVWELIRTHRSSINWLLSEGDYGQL